MDLRHLRRDHSIRKFHPVGTQIEDLLISAQCDISGAEDLEHLEHYGLARDAAYGAMLKAGMALMFHYGYRPDTTSHHIAVVRFTEEVLGKKHEPLIASFDRLRRTRHERLYKGRENTTHSECKHAIGAAYKLIRIVKEELEHPPKGR